MSIADRIYEAISKYNNKDFDNTLIQVLIAVDGTAKKVHPEKKNKERFILFVDDNLDIISRVTFGEVVISTDYLLNGKKFSEFIYDLCCSILHEGFYQDIYWNGKSLKYEGNLYHLPHRILVGLLFSVIGSSCNSSERINGGLNLVLESKDKKLRLKFLEYLGKKEEILKKIYSLFS